MRRASPYSHERLAEMHGTRCDDTGRQLTTRRVVATTMDRHINLVRRLIEPVACDVKTKMPLLDLDEAEKLLISLPRRSSGGI